MSSTAPSLQTALTDTLNAIVTVIDSVATTISQNASIIADVLIIGGLAFGIVQLFRRFGPAITGFFRGMF